MDCDWAAICRLQSSLLTALLAESSCGYTLALKANDTTKLQWDERYVECNAPAVGLYVFIKVVKKG